MFTFGNISLFIIFVFGLVAGTVAYFLQKDQETKQRATVLGAIAIASCSLVFGALTDLTQTHVKEASVPPSMVQPQIVKFEFGYRPIELAAYDTVLNDQQKERLRLEYTPHSSIMLEERFLSDFNDAARQSGHLRQAISRSYSGEEFYGLLQSALDLYGTLGTWVKVADHWIDHLQDVETKDTDAFRLFVRDKLGGFLHTNGLINHTTQGMERGDIKTDGKGIFDCDRPSVGMVQSYEVSDVRIGERRRKGKLASIAFQRFSLSLVSRGRREEIVFGLKEIIDKACTDNMIKFLKEGNDRFSKERKLIEEAVERVNAYYDHAIPTALRVATVISNPGRFGVAVLGKGKLAFTGDALKPLPITAEGSKEGQFTFGVPSREVRETFFGAVLPKNTSAQYRHAFKSATTEAYLKLQRVGKGYNSDFASAKVKFAD